MILAFPSWQILTGWTATSASHSGAVKLQDCAKPSKSKPRGDAASMRAKAVAAQIIKCDPGQMDGAAIAHLDRRDVAVMDAQPAQTRGRTRGCDRHGFANLGDTRMNGTCRHDADAMQFERTVDRQAKPAGGR